MVRLDRKWVAVIASATLAISVYFLLPSFRQTRTPPDFGPESVIIRVHDYDGMTRAVVIQQLGNPDRDEYVSFDNIDTGFRYDLQNWYTRGLIFNRLVTFHECTWYNRSETQTIWFHKVNGTWYVLSSIRYPADMRF